MFTLYINKHIINNISKKVRKAGINHFSLLSVPSPKSVKKQSVIRKNNLLNLCKKLTPTELINYFKGSSSTFSL